MQRRTLLKLAASTVALGAIGGGAWIQRRRTADQRRSARIVGPWEALGPGVTWLLPDLVQAEVVVPDRPHAHGEDDDRTLRAAIGRQRSFRVSSGPRRLRGAAFDQRPAPGVRRLLAIGDSTTFGWGVDDHASWPAQLEGWLRARGHAVEVLNGGVPGQSVENMAAYLRAEAPGLGLHGLLLGRRPWTEHDPPRYRQLLQALRSAVPGIRAMVALPPVGRFDPVGSARWEQEHAALAALLEPDGVPVLDLTGPFRAAQGDQGCDLLLEDGLLQVVRVATGEVLVAAPPTPTDLPRAIYELFERDPTVREPLIFDAGHSDAEGNTLAARLIGEALEAQGWLG